MGLEDNVCGPPSIESDLEQAREWLTARQIVALSDVLMERGIMAPASEITHALATCRRRVS